MNCCLCLTETEFYLPLKNGKTKKEKPRAIAVIIKKYFDFPVDTMRDVVCTVCWQHISDFHVFYLFVEQKQKELSLRSKDPILTKADTDVTPRADYEHEIGIKGNDDDENEVDIKNVPLMDVSVAVFAESNLSQWEGEENLLDEAKNTEKLKNVESTDPLNTVVVKVETNEQSESSNDTAEDTGPKGDITHQEEDDNSAEDDDEEETDSKDEDWTDEPVSKPKRRKRKQEKIDQRSLKGNAGKREQEKLASDDEEWTADQEMPETKATKSCEEDEVDLFIIKQAGDLTCDLCSKPLKTFTKLRKHFKEEHNRQGYISCCKCRFYRRQPYADHLEWHLNPNLWKCEICNTAFSSRKCYDGHMYKFHPKAENLKFQCTQCPLKFAMKGFLNMHIKKSHSTNIGEDVFKCDVCNKEYSHPNKLTAHKKLVHLRAYRTMCDICGKEFACKINVDVHKASVHQSVELTKVQCTVCNKWLKNAEVLYRHTKVQHRKREPKEHICDVCGASKPSHSALYIHKRYIHEAKTIDCSICGKKFRDNYRLKRHFATHTGIPFYTCVFCKEKFNVYEKMVEHKKEKHKDELNESK